VPGQREVTVLRLREHRFCLFVMNALEACTVGCENFACTFQGTSVVPYGQGKLRLAVRLPLVACDPQFYVGMSIECGGFEDGCDEGHKLNNHYVTTVAKLRWGFFLDVR